MPIRRTSGGTNFWDVLNGLDFVAGIWSLGCAIPVFGTIFAIAGTAFLLVLFSRDGISAAATSENIERFAIGCFGLVTFLGVLAYLTIMTISRAVEHRPPAQMQPNHIYMLPSGKELIPGPEVEVKKPDPTPLPYGSIPYQMTDNSRIRKKSTASG